MQSLVSSGELLAAAGPRPICSLLLQGILLEETHRPEQQFAVISTLAVGRAYLPWWGGARGAGAWAQSAAPGSVH